MFTNTAAGVISIEPPNATFPASGGHSNHFVVSANEYRIAFKIKCSNNEHYRVRPVYGFVEVRSKTKFEIVRLDGPVKDDKLAILWAEVPDDEIEPQAPFRAGSQQGEIVVLMKAN